MEQDTAINQAPTNEVQTTPKQSNFLVTLLSILLLISCLIAGFFAYQTQNLVKELTKQRNIVETTETTKTKPDYETYNDSVYKYSLNYPKGWSVTPTPSEGFGGVASFISPDKKNKFEIGKHIEKISQNQTLKEYFDSKQLETIDVVDQKDINLGNYSFLRLVVPIIQGNSVWKYGIYYTFEDNQNVYFIEYYTNDYTKDIAMVDEIVSTFKIDTENTVACTMEAKICPDGSAVGRSGPKCEFAPCPTSKSVFTSPQP